MLLPEKVKTAIERLVYFGDVVQVTGVRFVFRRDPKDEMLITLAIVGSATHLVTTDRDLLDLAKGRDDAAKRFRQRLPRTTVLGPDEFIRCHGAELGIERKQS